MRIKVAMLALIAAVTVLPTLNSPVEAKARRINIFNRVYNPYRYNPYYAARAHAELVNRQMAANALIQQVNAEIAAGRLTVQQGNQILIQGHF